MMSNIDSQFMQTAIQQAKAAQADGEVPVGAVLAKQGNIIATGRNRVISHHDPSQHAEIDAIRQAGQILNNYRLLDTTLYVTLEPCPMCVGAIIHARIQRLVFAAYDTKTGAVTSTMLLLDAPSHNHKVEWLGGVLAEDCAAMLSDFFAERRAIKN